MSNELTYNISIQGIEKLIAKLHGATQEQVITKSLYQSGLFLAAWSKQYRLSGPRPQFLGVRSGRLRASITAATPEHSGNVYSERIGTNVVYGAIHEFGGMTGRGGKVLIPARPFLRPAIENSQNQQMVIDTLTKNINEALSK